MKNNNQTTGFMGTYFDRDGVLRLERWVRVAAWGVLAVYFMEAGWNLYNSIYNSMIGGFPIDFYFLVTMSSRIFVGFTIFTLLKVAGQLMLILLDIEDNTRRAARGGQKEK